MVATHEQTDTLAFLAQLERQHKFGVPSSPGRSLSMQRADRIAAKYDSAQTTTENSRHWDNADHKSADAANSPGVRKKIRSRARYECLENNSIGNHIVRTLANDLVGSGPRLQVQTNDAEINKAIEQPFNRWSRRIHLAQKLRTMRQAKAVDGESFAQFINNRRLPSVQLDLRLIEADQISSPLFGFVTNPNAVDGITFDENGNPETYHLLKSHPGGNALNPFGFDPIPAEDMLHVFRMDRAGQHRGISEVQAALPLFAMLRRYTLAVLAGAETAADFAAVLQTDSSAQTEDGQSWDPEVEPFDIVDIDRNMMTTLPFGWQMKQFKPEQPTTTYEMFMKAIVNQIACVVDMPLNIALCNSSGFNYASGRLDHQTYFKSMQVERCYFEIEVLDRILSKWFDEAVFIADLIPAGLGPLEEIPHTWSWDGREHVDPAKEANAEQTKIKSGTLTRTRALSQRNLDIDEEDAKGASENDMTVKEYRAMVAANTFGSGSPVEVVDDEKQKQVKAAVADWLDENASETLSELITV